MTHITATFAKNNIGEVWEMAKQGPVEVLSNGSPVAFILSPEEFHHLSQSRSHLGRKRRIGLMAEQFKGFDTNELLNVDVSEAFKDYMP